MANDLLGVGVSGIKVSQTALRTVGHNIANAGTEGYSRQRVDTVSNPANNMAGNFIGTGAHVNSIDRIVNQFITEQLRTDTTLAADLNGFYNQVRQLDGLLANPATGISGSMERFFHAMQNAADDPTSIPARQLVLNEADNLAERFNSVYDRLQVIERGVQDTMEAGVAKVNSLAANIAQLNARISGAMGAANGASPNDLLDQRDKALTELSALLPVQVFPQGNGQINVVVASGQSLVLGPDARRLELTPSAHSAAQSDLLFVADGRKTDITAGVTGGELGGALRFRDQVLKPSFNEIGHMALVLADTMNSQHQMGLDLQGEFGGLFFNDVNDTGLARARVAAHSANTATTSPLMALYIRDSGQTTASDYELKIGQGGLYTVVQKSDNREVASGSLPGQMPFSLRFDGLELQIEKGSLQAGDRFSLQPTRTAAQSIQAVLGDPEDLALASPLLTDASLSNRGTGSISAGQVLAITGATGEDLPLFATPGVMAPPLLVVFNTPYSYDVLDNSDPGRPVQLSPPIRDQRYQPGMINNLFASEPGQTQVSSAGELIGLPEGRSAQTVAITGPADTTGLNGPANGYPAEMITISRPGDTAGQAVTTRLVTGQNASAKEIATALGGIPGVQANAFSYAEISDLNLSYGAPLQIHLNGEPLVQYQTDPVSGLPVLPETVPDPNQDPNGFYDYLAASINDNPRLQAAGIYAVAGADHASGRPELRLHATEGDDLRLAFTGAANDSIAVGDGENPTVELEGLGHGQRSNLVVGGQLDVKLAEGLVFGSQPGDSLLFGNTAAPGFAQSTYLGLQASINGAPRVGDRFSLTFNADASNDNRNAMALSALQNGKIFGGPNGSLTEKYGALVERVGISTHSAKINRDAALQVVQQTQALRESISGVNLDEEAADLIRFEQLFSANAQVISVARDIFERLINSF